MAKPAAVFALTGSAGLGKSTIVAAILRELELTAWTLSAQGDDLALILPMIERGMAANLVLVIDDAHTASPETLHALFGLRHRKPAALPRLVLIGQRPLADELRLRVDAVAVLFPMTNVESEQYVRWTLGVAPPRHAARLLPTVISRARGNPSQLREATFAWSRVAAPPPAHIATRSRRVVPGAVALIVLVLAMLALTASFTGSSPPIGAALPSSVR